ncbi:hypothetical protein AB6A40_000030 [Gnathostoma spinigerum]|uniref:Nuclear hormone receptor HR96 n=1 Tax=Gnathostoma spinigerum TaxID=75299 RepID=A0ABD6E389_9BILA
MSHETEEYSSRSSNGEYDGHPLSPPSVGLDPPNVINPTNLSSKNEESTHEHHSLQHNEEQMVNARKRTLKEGSSTERRTATKICRVCGDKAYSYNFNVITCESCKAFFRRNANKEKEIRCPFNEQCEINLVSRRFCQRCRLKKCFDVGMKKEWIMSEEARLEKKQRIQNNRERRLMESVAAAVSRSDGKKATVIQPSPRITVPSSSSSTVSSISTNPESPSSSRPSQKPLDTTGKQQSCDPHEAASTSKMILSSATSEPQPSSSNVNVSRSLCALQPSSSTSCDSAKTAQLECGLSVQTTSGFRPPILKGEMSPTATFMESQPFLNARSQIHSVPSVPPIFAVQTQCEEPFTDNIAQRVQLVQDTPGFEKQLQRQQHEQQQQQAATKLLQHQTEVLQLAQREAVQLGFLRAQQRHHIQELTQLAPTCPATYAASGLTSAAISPISPVILSPPRLPAFSVASHVLQPPPQSAGSSVLLSGSPTSSRTEPDTVSIPRAFLLQLLEQNQSLSLSCLSTGCIPQRCRCTCTCGHYSPEVCIVDQVIKDLTNQQLNSTAVAAPCNSMPSNTKNLGVPGAWNSPTCSEQRESFDRGLKIARDPTVQKSGASLLEKELVDVADASNYCKLTAADNAMIEDVLNANVAWAELEDNEKVLHEAGNPSKLEMVNMADGAIRRMIKMMKRIETFKRIHHDDQLQLLKGSCMEYIILRGTMSFDPTQNTWKGPTQQSGYDVKMDAMKEAPDNLFENTIRFYATFKESWRMNERLMLILGMLVVFNPEIPGLRCPDEIMRTNQRYRSILKRLMFTLCDENRRITDIELKGILDKLWHLKALNHRAQRMIGDVDQALLEPLLVEIFSR